MDEVTYKRWWALHYRLACGETLSTDEQRFYELGEEELDREESLTGSKRRLSEEKARSVELRSKYLRLKDMAEKLEAKLSAKESEADNVDHRKTGIAK